MQMNRLELAIRFLSAKPKIVSQTETEYQPNRKIIHSGRRKVKIILMVPIDHIAMPGLQFASFSSDSDGFVEAAMHYNRESKSKWKGAPHPPPSPGTSDNY